MEIVHLVIQNFTGRTEKISQLTKVKWVWSQKYWEQNIKVYCKYLKNQEKSR